MKTLNPNVEILDKSQGRNPNSPSNLEFGTLKFRYYLGFRT